MAINGSWKFTVSVIFDSDSIKLLFFMWFFDALRGNY